jgi:ABC-type glycerol-3-phosphate transport system substrate-binding protein
MVIDRRAFRRRLSTIALAGTLALTSVSVAGCAGEGSAQQSSEDSPLLIQINSTFLTIQNRAGLPLTELKVTVVPYSRTEFTKFLTRLESGEKRDVMMNELSSRDGTTFSPRQIKAKSVRVTAVDVVGKQYEVEVPWS